jgi:16S rRNA (cytosine1402-N4)-methyltransferase
MDALGLKEGGVYVDATFGGGGYSREMLARADCRVIAFDRDPDAIDRGQSLVQPAKGKFTLHQGRFGDLALA